MYMRKKDKSPHIWRRFSLSSPARTIFRCGFTLIFASSVRLLWELEEVTVLSSASYYGSMLEYPVAALMLLTGGTLLADYIGKRYEEHDDP